MCRARDHLLATIHDNCLIVSGGYDGLSQEQSIVEEYNEKEDQWIPLPSMARASSAGVLFETE